jgi:arylamine N-acetyltransferase
LDLEEPQDGGSGSFVIASEADGRTLFLVEDDGSLSPQYRFGPGEWALEDFRAASERLQAEPSLSWTESRFATRLLSGGPDRVTLLKDRIKFRRDGDWTAEPIATADWIGELDRWFDLVP